MCVLNYGEAALTRRAACVQWVLFADKELFCSSGCLKMDSFCESFKNINLLPDCEF